MTYCVASNKTFNLIYEIGTVITSSGGYGEEQKKHIWEDAFCNLQRPTEIVIYFNVI